MHILYERVQELPSEALYRRLGAGPGEEYGDFGDFFVAPN